MAPIKRRRVVNSFRNNNKKSGAVDPPIGRGSTTTSSSNNRLNKMDSSGSSSSATELHTGKHGRRSVMLKAAYIAAASVLLHYFPSVFVLLTSLLAVLVLFATCASEHGDSSTPNRQESTDDLTAADGACGADDSHDSAAAVASFQQEICDRAIAAALEEELNRQADEAAMAKTESGKAWKFVERVLKIHQDMLEYTTRTGVGSVVGRKLSVGGLEFDTVAADDMVLMTESTIGLQTTFRNDGKPWKIDIGYHYTLSDHLETIRTNGLLTKRDRVSSNIKSNYNGSTYGDGVYTANLPFVYEKFGDAGLLVARLQGNSAVHGGYTGSSAPVNTVVVSSGNPNEVRVLKLSAQCIPLIVFKSETRSAADSGGKQVLRRYYGMLQEAIDEFFNIDPGATDQLPVFGAQGFTFQSGLKPAPTMNSTFQFGASKPPPQAALNSTAGAFGAASPSHQPAAFHFGSGGFQTAAATTSTFSASPFGTAVPRQQNPFVASSAPSQGYSGFPVPSQKNPFGASSAPLQGYSGFPVLSQKKPPSMPSSTIIQYQAPGTLSVAGRKVFTPSPPSYAACPICWVSMSDQSECISTKACNHQFHRECIEKALKHSSSCPTCRAQLEEPRGKMPSGTMKITHSKRSCASFESVGSISIRYSIPSGKQKSYHDNPGMPHGSADRKAFLPNNVQGQQLLERLKYAFSRGLVFLVGTSLASGDNNAVTWASIHHKTSLSGSQHGYPDPAYFVNANAELDAVGVPNADICQSIQY